MLLDRAADHLALHGERVHVALGLAGPEELLAAGHAQFHELVALRDADLADAAVGVDGAAGGLLQVVAVLHGHFPSLDAAGRLHVQLDLGRDDAAPVAHRDAGARRACCARPRRWPRPPRSA